MGVVDFDPDKWTQANGGELQPGRVAKVANPAKVEGQGGELSQLSQLSQPAQGALPDNLRRGLVLLREMPPPRITRPEVWPAIVADALRLAGNPDVAKALREGWHPLHFWGCCPSADANPALEGLAVRLMGRKPLIYDTHAIMESAAATHSVFMPRAVDGAIFLWDLGRGQSYGSA